jgi:hypothetical protein
VAEESGTSVKGRQDLLFVPAGGGVNFYVRINSGFPAQPKKIGFVSLEMNYSGNYYQIDGKSLWYEGVWFQTPFSPFFQITIVANWTEAGIAWTAGNL